MNAPEIITILGKGSAFDGKLTFEGTVRIDGDFSGEIRTDGTLVVGDSAKVTAQIEASVVVIEGRVEGDVRASERIELSSTGRVAGTLYCPSLEIQRGAVFDGRSVMTSTPVPTSADADA
ncbi:bactofilin family protein [Paraliomyxa miuraensis]|uniref:bactofilin family protein n=1 Tax=Paraliomyxa miuraensis TaxID=376150 RepID=UPI00224DFFB4|nr:polymer-forming cytoskeletal protein [Paraliomyxa miuraensis]